MDAPAIEADGNLRLAFTTWVVALHASGVPAMDAEIAALCGEVMEDPQAAQRLVDTIGARLANSGEPEVARRVAGELFGDRVTGRLGEGDRAERLSRIRKYQFGRQLPWLARIWERHDGRVVPSWLLVEQVTDEVWAMDHNPWNDIDEERRIPVSDFQVLWELDGCTSLAID